MYYIKLIFGRDDNIAFVPSSQSYACCHGRWYLVINATVMPYEKPVTSAHAIRNIKSFGRGEKKKNKLKDETTFYIKYVIK